MHGTTLGSIPETFRQGKLHHEEDSHLIRGASFMLPAPCWNLLTRSSSQTVLPDPSMALSNVRWCTSPESQFLPWTSWPISLLTLWPPLPCFFPQVWAAFPKQLLPSHLAFVALAGCRHLV